MDKHKKLINARTGKKDEFYTRLCDIEEEILKHGEYVDYFKGKVVLCNCDNPEESNFAFFFRQHFEEFGIQKLVTTHYARDGASYKSETFYDAKSGNIVTVNEDLAGNGDFLSQECIDILDACDVVVTNPPFSLFRNFISLMVTYQKKFLVIGSTNAISYASFFSLLQNRQVWTGYCFNKAMTFEVGEGYQYNQKLSESIEDGKKYAKVSGIAWYTNIELHKIHKFLKFNRDYHSFMDEYPRYENYPAINVNKVSEIPDGYDGIMGVPITFLSQYCPEQFEIVGLGYGEQAKAIGMGRIGEEFLNLYLSQGNKGNYVANNVLCCYIDKDGKAKIPYARILIKRR